MDNLHYETVLLLAAGAALGQVLIILMDMSFSLWSFLPVLIFVILLGSVSVRNIAKGGGLTRTGTVTRILTGVWMFLVWELFRRRFIWVLDIFKFFILAVVLCFFYLLVKRKWRE